MTEVGFLCIIQKADGVKGEAERLGFGGKGGPLRAIATVMNGLPRKLLAIAFQRHREICGNRAAQSQISLNFKGLIQGHLLRRKNTFNPRQRGRLPPL